MSFPTISLVSFDRESDAAVREQQEDRSLNLLLRQRRVRSEMYRLPLNPSENDTSLLNEILSLTPRRPLVLITRDLGAYPAQQTAVTTFAQHADLVILVSIGGEDSAPSLVATLTEHIRIHDDGPGAIGELADRLMSLVVAQA